MHRRQNKSLNDSEGQRGNIFLYGEKLEVEINIETQMSTNLHQIKTRILSPLDEQEIRNMLRKSHVITELAWPEGKKFSMFIAHKHMHSYVQLQNNLKK